MVRATALAPAQARQRAQLAPLPPAAHDARAREVCLALHLDHLSHPFT
jgi:hypothetical protein